MKLDYTYSITLILVMTTSFNIFLPIKTIKITMLKEYMYIIKILEATFQQIKFYCFINVQ